MSSDSEDSMHICKEYGSILQYLLQPTIYILFIFINRFKKGLKRNRIDAGLMDLHLANKVFSYTIIIVEFNYTGYHKVRVKV
jgi:hypothetical protein